MLDVGTGTGIWALDFGDRHPNAQVIGVDISPMQPGWSVFWPRIYSSRQKCILRTFRTAPNVKFEIDDIEKDWTYKKVKQPTADSEHSL